MNQGADKYQRASLRCLATASLRSADLDGDLAVLDRNERDTAQRLRAAENKRDYVAAHALLRRMLSAAVPEMEPSAWRFDRTPRGKPFVRSLGDGARVLPFSLSHACGMVACVIGQAGEFGLDVECDVESELEDLMASVCSTDERAQLGALARSERTARFLDFWTLKEAYLKARGTGIADGLMTTAFDLRVAGVVSGRFDPEAAAGWDFAMYRPTEDSRIALAMARCGEAPIVVDAALVGRDGASTALRPIRTGTIRKP